MTKGESIEIERVGNGWLVRPVNNGVTTSSADLMCFQKMGEYESYDTKTLLGFIAEHFAEPAPK